MNAHIQTIYEVIEEIKQNITDNKYKTVMDNLMLLNLKLQDPNAYYEWAYDKGLIF